MYLQNEVMMFGKNKTHKDKNAQFHSHEVSKTIKLINIKDKIIGYLGLRAVTNQQTLNFNLIT